MKIGAVGALANASTTATPRSCASRSCLRSSSRKIPSPRASGSVVACTEYDASRSSPLSIIRSSVWPATPTTRPSIRATDISDPAGLRRNHQSNSSPVSPWWPHAWSSSAR
jgi:hypothetical protein